MSEIDDIFDAIARREVEETNRAHGQHILDALDDSRARRGTEEDPLIQALRAADKARLAELEEGKK
jgi:hypothetical protein